MFKKCRNWVVEKFWGRQKALLWLVIVLSTILITSEEAFATLNILQNPISIETTATIQKSFEINISNTHPFPIYNISFSPLDGFNFPNNLQLEVNKSLLTNFTVLTSNEFSSQLTSRVKFNFFTQVQTNPGRHNVTINPNSFAPNNIAIEIGDTVIWFNNGTLSHNIRSQFFDITLTPNQTYEYTFNSLGTFEIQDVGFNFGMVIAVNPVSNQQLTNNPNFDINFTININSQLIDTNVNFEIIDNNLTVAYNSQTEGLLRITNTGSKTARNIILKSSSNWISFEENNFSIDSNANNLVVYKAKPIINTIDETNKTSTISLTIEGINIATQTKIVSIFVPYESSLIPSNVSRDDLIKRINELQEILKRFAEQNNTIIIYKDPVVPIENLTQEPLYKALQEQEEIKNRLLTMENLFKLFGDGLSNNTATIDRYNSNQSVTSFLLKKAQDSFNSLKIIGFVIIPLGVLSYLSYNYFSKKTKEEKKKKLESHTQNIIELKE